ncbi:MAG: UDP-glucose dehydrogenase family protein [Acidimicrobiales bacterium]
MKQRVSVIGSGYVGTVVAACLAHIGHQVVGVESDTAKLAALGAGHVPFYEPGLESLVREGLGNGRLRFSADYGDAMDASDIVFICVGTPPGPDGQPDMTAMASVARSIATNLDRPHILVNKSTVPVGSGRWLASMIEEVSEDRARTRELVQVVSNPEFLREGSAIGDYLQPDRVVLGSDNPAAIATLVDLYEPILAGGRGQHGRVGRVPVVETDLTTAEMTKYASNAFLATKISFANEMARICVMVGADITEVTAGMGLDRRIGGEFLGAGLGWGGSCFAKDVNALIATALEYGYAPAILQAAVAVNGAQRHLVVESLRLHLKTLRGTRVAILGLAFKPGTDDLRDSPALDLARRLVAAGVFVTAYDPVVPVLPGLAEVAMASDARSAARHADAVVVATEWPEFESLDLVALAGGMRGYLFVDGRNVFDPAAVRAAGLRYVGIGRGAPRAAVTATGSDRDGDRPRRGLSTTGTDRDGA